MYIIRLEDPKNTIRSMLESWRDHVEIINFIRHPSTVKVISEMLGLQLEPANGLYEYEEGDIVVAVTLKKPPRGREVEVKPEDLDVYIITVEFAE